MEFFPAWAKVNLGLDVRAKRTDGYHDVRMIMQTVSLADCIGLEIQEHGISLQVQGAELSPGENNLAYRAAKLLQEHCQVTKGAKIELKKRIPLAAGLAGGSADAAAVLYGLSKIWQLNLNEGELHSLALRLGSDVPFALLGGTALAEGRGEILTPLTPLPDCYLVLARANLEVSTAWAYRELDACPERTAVDIDVLLLALCQGDLAALARQMENSFEPVVTARYPVIRELKEALLDQGALGAVLTGSGPTVFGLFTSLEEATRAVTSLAARSETFVVRPVMSGAGRGWREAETKS
jgi:4-diphosphocytidyl-2-C-methyl-D-erythritol kinase